ncbi:cysteine protease StiP domain-containing protein [Moraxella sp. CTOTU49803]|uniref:cysteine protease StiP domain-containing protein n=1 Tax=Moraxella sp. CTOTU49803 TaxID=2953840 RepID=UPI0028AD9DBD|nr:cysteine protease StiP domain-containing protein [Moraxella sp. CTOTU49803]
MTIQANFSGSYLSSEVTLLLDIVSADSVNDISPTQKEALIQSGQRHYSDMLTLEKPPSATHEALYNQALMAGKQRMANDVTSLAFSLHQLFHACVSASQPLILVSLVRAGLPIGVLLQKALSDASASYALASQHYGVSIIRDRGLDPVALQYILQQHPHSPIVFVDGWTGKGAIYGELQRSLAQITDKRQQAQLFHQGEGVIPLVTLADPAGVAWLSASNDDWLMPASLLNSTVSGLISRTLYREPSDGLHQAVYYDKLQPWDRSGEFIQTIDALRKQTPSLTPLTGKLLPTFATQSVIDDLAARFAISNRNRIKPTIAEATRAILRRDPECVLVNEMADGQDTALLRHLCEEKNIQLIADASIAPYQAVTIIKNRSQ